jgi:DNA-binding IscR family transcriptional regulator
MSRRVISWGRRARRNPPPGPRGGVELGRAPEAINLWSVVRAMEGPVAAPGCVLGLRACSEKNPCPLHQQWAPLRARMQRLLEQTTLASLAQGLRETTKWGPDSWVRIPVEAARARMDSERRRSS